jgi:hypothetical protein
MKKYILEKVLYYLIVSSSQIIFKFEVKCFYNVESLLLLKR